jgi:hypothetical protein
MSQNQNHGKMKAWRKPEYKLVDGKKTLINQSPFVRRKSKGTSQIANYPGALLLALFEKAGIRVAT